MKSKITDKFQITIPKEIRSRLKLARNDFLEWKFEKGYLIVRPLHDSFLNYKGKLKVGKGDIDKDIETAKRKLAGKNR